MKTKKGEETYYNIIEAAEQLFMEKSVTKVTISDIVQRAGVAKGTFYLYFESKEALIWSFINHKFGYADLWMKEIILRGYSDEELCEIVEYIVSFVKKNIAILKLIHNVRFHSFLGINNMEEKYINNWIKPFSLWLEKGRLNGSLKINDAQFMACYLVITIHELFNRALMNELPYSIDELGKELKVLIIKLLK